MLDSVVELLARTNGMATGRSGPMESEVAAVFTTLEAVHSDYVGMFDMVRRAIVAGEPVQDITQTLLLRRPEEASERTAVLAHTRLLLADMLGSDAYPFLHALSGYFVALPLSGEGHVASALQRAMEQAQRNGDDSLHARAEIARSTHASLRCLQEQWGAVCREHAKLEAMPEATAVPAAADDAVAAITPLMAAIGARMPLRSGREFLADALL